jgi:hypothetical protein
LEFRTFSLFSFPFYFLLLAVLSYNMSSPTNSRGHSFAWPPSNQHAPSSSIPSSSAHGNYADISIKEILDKYRDDKELMKHVLAAKAEEDKVWSNTHGKCCAFESI